MDTIDIERLIHKYNTPVPRYTSYPTAVEFSADFNPQDYFTALTEMTSEKPVSLYLHIPFCEHRCFYCGCNVIVSKRKEMNDDFLKDIMNEIIYKTSFIKFKPVVSQLHFGGGTPNFLRISDWQKLMDFLHNYFIFSSDIELSIELDPMVMDVTYLENLRSFGFNRVSFGIQDVNEQTQRAIGRIQNMTHIDELFQKARELGFTSVNVDFIYGLPFQNLETYQANINWILKFKPDRMAMFSYAHIPWIKKHQAQMPVEAMPNASEKLRIYLSVESQLNMNGYVSIGMDHFAKVEDPMSQALKNKSLHRNFMGYTTQANLDQLAFGPSAISHVQGVFVQNHVKLRAYEKSVRDKVELFEKGIKQNNEDKLRSYIIQSIMNNLYLDINECNTLWGIDFNKKFSTEIENLREFEKNELVKIYPDKIEVKPYGRYIVRHLGKIFDAYRKPSEEFTKRFSRGI
ncbi:MAG: oxygen-independent coproporphyrinogen III oxidase [Spirochaetia bacterium]|nr:oxygen-independent coproporphyrinogen III oxidase [Spirochaetia bacterium]